MQKDESWDELRRKIEYLEGTLADRQKERTRVEEELNETTAAYQRMQR